jgi:FtsP/CotA-like multicopper oxidase with cupredoxin domain
MKTPACFARVLAVVISALAAIIGITPVAIAGPGLTPATSNTGQPVLAPTYYANSPLGLRPDLVSPNGPMIDTGTAMRKFVDVLPSIPGLAPTTNAGSGTMPNGDAKYLTLGVPGVWPSDQADYYHIAIVEYAEQMHSDLPKATTLRGYVQIEEPGQATPAGSRHVALNYPDGSPILLPDAAGVPRQVYGYDKPHYLGPTIVATKDKATRIKWSNLLPPGAFNEATGQRNGDLPIPVDATLAGGAMPQNRVAIHLHGGLSPWISDGTPHQWTVPVGETRFGYLTDIAVTAVGAGYTAPVVVIDPPQSLAKATASINAGGSVTSLTLTQPGAFYAVGSPPAVTLSAPPATIHNASAAATSTISTSGGTKGRVTALNITNAGSGFTFAPTVTIAAPPATTQAVATATLANGVTGKTLSSIANTTAGAGYTSAPTVTVAAPPSAVAATGTPTISTSNGALSSVAVNGGNFGYWTAPLVTVSAPPAAVQATATATVSSSTGALTAISRATTGFGYWTAPTVTVATPPFAVRATATATVSGGRVTSFAVSNSATNFGYWTAPTVTLTGVGTGAAGTAVVLNGRVVSITVTNGGSGYTIAPTVTIANGTAGVRATASAQVANGAITGYTILTAGSGYSPSTPPVVTVAAGTSGTTATATAQVANGAVTGFTVTAAGSGYNPASRPTITVGAPSSGIQATATASVSTAGAVTGYTVTNAGRGYVTVPAVTVSAPPATVTATGTATITGGRVTALTITNAGAGYFSAPAVTVALDLVTRQATATAAVAPDGSIGGLTITDAGTGYQAAPTVTIGAPARATQATATASVSAGGIVGVTITNAGAGYLSTPNVSITDARGSGATIAALVAMPTGVTFRQVPDMVGNAVGPTGYTPPAIGEGTLYYTNQQSARLMWYHDHTSGTTRLNAYMGEAAPYIIRDPAVDPVFAFQSTPVSSGATSLQGYVPEEIIPLVLQDKTFVPQDILLEDANWDTVHWGQPGDLWFPHVYETNQNPSFWSSASQAGRWDWGPWFAIVYPAMYALPSGRYGDVTTTPEAFMDTSVVNGVAYPTLTVEPRAYRFLVLNGTNDRFLNLGFYVSDPTQIASDGRTDTEVLAGPAFGAQPTAYPGNVFADDPVNASLTPWPIDGHWAPLPSEMGPPMIQIGTEGGMLPHWVQVDPIPVNYELNRRAATVTNVSQNNDATQICFPECHGLYIGSAERADVIIDFSKYAGRTLILYNDAPAPNPGFDPRIDYYTGNDPGNAGNYATGGAPNTEIGFGPNTRTMMQVKVLASLSSRPIDYPLAAVLDPVSGLYTYDPTALGYGRVVGTTVGAGAGILQSAYVATQQPPVVGQVAYNVAGAADASGRFSTGYTDQYADMFLASQNEPMFFVTNPGPLTITGVAVTGQTTATGAASGIGLGGASTGSNPTAGSGTGYTYPPTVAISPPTNCVLGAANCTIATATATVTGGQVTGVTLTNPGSGYTEAPSVNIVAAYAVGTIGLTNAGAGYATAPAVTISGGGGSGATAVAAVSGGKLTGLTVTNPGSGFTGQPTITIAAPAVIAASGSAVMSGSTVADVLMASGGTYAVGTVPTVTFAAPPPVRQAKIDAIPFHGICCVYAISDPGSGYLVAPLLSVTDPSVTPALTGATGQAVITNGAITDVIPLTTGPLTYTQGVMTVPAPTGTAVTAQGTAVMNVARTAVDHVTVTNAGSNYVGAAPTVTFTGGAQATAVASLIGGGTGATAVALTSNTFAFVVPAALPNSGVPLSANAKPVALPPGLASLMGCNAAQTSCPNASAVVLGRLMNPAIQELFEPFYGRMNATLGIEMPNQSLAVQTTLPLNYIDPATEQLEPGTAQMWKITHNGVDTHPVHFHLVNVQVVNRVGWDGTVKPPEDNEIGWKETVKMNPLEDIVVAMRAEMPKVPFGLDRSIRPQDPSQPLGVNMGFTQFAISGLNGNAMNGMPVPVGAVGIGDPTTVVNSIEDYDNEYVWHCHILGHEENDFMRALVATSQTTAPDAPTSFAVSQAVGGKTVATWVDPTPVIAQSTYGNPKNEIGFRLERALSAAGPWSVVANAAANTTTISDPLTSALPVGTTVYYRVSGYNAMTLGKLIGGSNTGIGAPSATASVTIR